MVSYICDAIVVRGPGQAEGKQGDMQVNCPLLPYLTFRVFILVGWWLWLKTFIAGRKTVNIVCIVTAVLLWSAPIDLQRPSLVALFTSCPNLCK